ncbi:MAG: ATPase, T2SS/T4P/T4SS family [Desulfosudaceae bacterium]
MADSVFSETGEKVIIRQKDGSIVKGMLAAGEPGAGRLRFSPLKTGQDEEPRQMAIKEMAAVFFVKDPDQPLIDGMADGEVWYKQAGALLSDPVIFTDDQDIIRGTFSRDAADDSGLLLLPEKTGGNIIRIFIPFSGPGSASEGPPLGHTLVAEGMISSDQLDQGLRHQQALRKKRIGEIFVERGVVDHEEVARVLKIQEAQSDRKIGDILIASGAITAEQLTKALTEQKKDRNKRLGQILIELDFINEEMLALALALRHGLPYVDLNSYPVDSLAVHLVSEEVAWKMGIIPIQMASKILTVAFSDPTGLWAKQDLAFHTGLQIKEVLASPTSINTALTRFYGSRSDTYLDSIPLDEVGSVEEIKSAPPEGIDVGEKAGQQKPVVALVNHLIKTAVEKKASDIHVEAEAKEARIFLRIDGVRIREMTLPAYNLPSVIARMKIMAGMNIAERRLPQDGRAKVRVASKLVDLRFSCMPTVHGESMVVRILDKEAGLMRLDDIGFMNREIEALRRLLARNYGMLLVTGPTGSGKSSTIYACLQEPLFGSKNVITLEDPVEYELPGLSQVQIKDAIGLTFAGGLRQILRHDPDVVVVGEIRDGETAKIAVQASLTGHLLISTLHTNTAAEAFVRLADMGIEPYLISSSILGVLSQRLLRKICRNCISVDPEGARKLKAAHFPLPFPDKAEFFHGEGCQECNQTGYKGRTVVYEFLPTNEKIKQAALRQETARALRELAVKDGMSTIEATALRKALEGITSVEEIIPLAPDDS